MTDSGSNLEGSKQQQMNGIEANDEKFTINLKAKNDGGQSLLLEQD